MADTERDLRMIMDPSLWPRWPLLPLKRHKKDYSMPDMGCMCEGALEDRFVIYEINCWHPKETPLPWPEIARYNTAEELIADGWKID